MLARTKKTIKPHSKAAALLVVYVLHMVLFQALMAGPVNNNDTNFRPLFTHTNQTPPNHPPNHPAVTYYTLLAKQGNLGLRSCCQVLVSYMPVAAFFDVDATILMERRYQFVPSVLSHIGDDYFKLYRALRTFLI